MLALSSVLAGSSTLAADPGGGGAAFSPHAVLRDVGPMDVRWTTGFWADRFELCRTAMLPTLHETLLDPACSAQLNRIAFAAGLRETNPGGVNWADGDCYKWIESMAHVYGVTRDPALDGLMDEWIGIIARAQDDDGYISTNVGHDRDARLQMPYLHELYNMGHLLTAACVHFRATGKTTFLAVAEKLADYLHGRFAPNPPELVHFPWNPSAHMGLVEMYRTTGRQRYLETARIMIGNRGSSPGGGDHRNGGTDQTQDRVPLRFESEAVGHAVCATYLYCGAADLYAETGDAELLAALRRIREDIVSRKMDITGSVGMGDGTTERGDPVHEAFGPAYALPNLYNETCSNIGNGMFNRRMLLLTGEAGYADLMETVAYNSLNAAVDLAGKHWFYCNPLKWEGIEGEKHHTGRRWRTNNCYCCPPSVARTTAKLHNWVYSTSETGLRVHLYGGNRLDTVLPTGGRVRLTQETDYPWDGRVTISFEEVPAEGFPLYLRIPGWAETGRISVNGQAWPGAAEPGTYAVVERRWQAGDSVELDLPMPVRLISAHPRVTALRNMVAVTRGPLVYCLELPLEDGGRAVWDAGVFLPENSDLVPERRDDFFGGITCLRGTALTQRGREAFVRATAGVPGAAAEADDDDRLYRPFAGRDLPRPEEGTVEIRLIPYYAWANRGLSMMEVWIPLAR